MRLRISFKHLSFVLATCTAHAAPEPQPGAEAGPGPLPDAQNWYNNAPFSGAIYVVGPDGQPAQGQCPAHASVNCGDQGHYGWCCPGGCSCQPQQNQNGYIGCCPAGSTCGGAVSVQTVTVTAQPPPPPPPPPTPQCPNPQQCGAPQCTYPQPCAPTPWIAPQPWPTTQYWNNPYNPYTQPAPVFGGFCQTLTMRGPGLPAITQGQCGTILIVSRSGRSWKPIGFGLAGVLLLMQLAIARMFQWI